MKIRYTVLARVELANALEYYEANASLEIAKTFFAEFEVAKKRISASPHAFPEIRLGVRRCLFSSFPYEINFEIVDDKTLEYLSSSINGGLPISDWKVED